MKEVIETYNNKQYKKVFDNTDSLTACKKYCCFCKIGENGIPECHSPQTKDFRFDGCAVGKFHWEETN